MNIADKFLDNYGQSLAMFADSTRTVLNLGAILSVIQDLMLIQRLLPIMLLRLLQGRSYRLLAGR